jgi:hypothetical protein
MCACAALAFGCGKNTGLADAAKPSHGAAGAQLALHDAGPPAPPVPLVELTGFSEASPAQDPFNAFAPDRRLCERPAFVIEQDLAGVQTLEVRTDVCNYLTLVQPTQWPVAKGDTLRLLMWHNTLGSDESALAHAVLQFGEHVEWSVDVPIPAEAESYAPAWQATEDVPLGTPVFLHIRNHGANSWRFGELTVEAHSMR